MTKNENPNTNPEILESVKRTSQVLKRAFYPTEELDREKSESEPSVTSEQTKRDRIQEAHERQLQRLRKINSWLRISD